uniref:FAD-binding domain-containing protein n=1 Tax=Odontella aurita TaxID=265563 RepID=A0A7S4K9U6_9STRA
MTLGGVRRAAAAAYRRPSSLRAVVPLSSSSHPLALTRSFASSDESSIGGRRRPEGTDGGRSPRHFDVLVVGGGAVGSALAADLLRRSASSGSVGSLRVGLIEARSPPTLSAFLGEGGGIDDGGGGGGGSVRRAGTPNARAYALSPASLDFVGRARRGGVGGDGKGNDAGDAETDGSSRASIVDALESMGRVGWYEFMQVWESDGPATLNFAASDLADDAADSESAKEDDVLGAVVEDGPLVAALWDELRGGGGSIELISPASITSITAPSTAGGSKPPPPVEVSYTPSGGGSNSDPSSSEGRRTVTASLLVAADGANSYVRRTLGMPTSGWGYGRRAVTCTVEVSRSMWRTAYQRFLPDGPIALLPVWTEGTPNDGGDGDGGKCYANVVWSTTPSRAKELQSLDPDQFLDALNENLQHGPRTNPPLVSDEARASLPGIVSSLAFGVETLIRGASEGLTMSQWSEKKPFAPPPLASGVVGPRFAFDLSLSQACSYVAPRVALVGDAAHTVHPMAGQGLNQGLGDAACLSRVIAEATQSGMDVGGTMQFLSEYDAERRAEVAAAMAGIQALHVAFGMKDFVPGIYARSLGMNLVNAVGPVRRHLAAVAAGRKGVFR